MKITVRNKKTNKTFTVDAVDEEPKNGRIHRPANVSDADDKKEEDLKLTKKEIEDLKELASLVPELKKLLKVEEEEHKDDDKGDDKEEEAEEVEEFEEEAQDSDEDDSDNEEEVILEEEEKEEEIDEDEDEEDVLEDECGDGVHDSKASIGSIEANVADSDTLSREEEVAKAFDSRYKKALNK